MLVSWFPKICPMGAGYIVCVQVQKCKQVIRLLYISRGLLWAWDSEGDRVPTKYSLTHLWTLGFLLQFCLSSLSYSFLFLWHGNGSKCTGPRVFGIPSMKALLSFSICRKRDMLRCEHGVLSLVRVSPVEQPPESGYGLCQCLASSETKVVFWKDWRPSVVCPSCLSRACCCICYCPPSKKKKKNSPHQTRKYQPNCPDTVNHFLPTSAASPSICFFFFFFNVTTIVLFSSFTLIGQNYRIRTCMYFMPMQNVGKHIGAVNDSTWPNEGIGKVIPCNHKKTARARFCSHYGSWRPCQLHHGSLVRCD